MSNMSQMSHTPREFIAYVLVVALGLIVDVGILYALTTYFGVWYFLSAGISFTIALVANYILSIRYVFTHRSASDSKNEFVVFFLIGLSALFVNQLVMYVGVEKFALPILVGKAIALPLTFAWNFGWNKILLFRK